MTDSKKLVLEVPISAEVGGYVSEEVIRERAYEIYEERGCAGGLEVEDWLAAEAELAQRSAPA